MCRGRQARPGEAGATPGPRPGEEAWALLGAVSGVHCVLPVVWEGPGEPPGELRGQRCPRLAPPWAAGLPGAMPSPRGRAGWWCGAPPSPDVHAPPRPPDPPPPLRRDGPSARRRLPRRSLPLASCPPGSSPGFAGGPFPPPGEMGDAGSTAGVPEPPPRRSIESLPVPCFGGERRGL